MRAGYGRGLQGLMSATETIYADLGAQIGIGFLLDFGPAGCLLVPFVVLIIPFFYLFLLPLITLVLFLQYHLAFPWLEGASLKDLRSRFTS
jgi:hypothetical protein